jgi:haloalkane dehalogenase
MRTEFKPSPELYPFTSRWLDSQHGQVHYLDEGRGRPILLLHGNPTWSFVFRKMIPELCAAGFRCVAPDYLGFGLSDHPDDFGYTAAEHAAVVGELVQKLDLADVIVMGQDWGGPLAVSTATEHPERVAGLALGATFAWPATGLTRWIARILHTRWMHRHILHSDRFIERTMRATTKRRLSAAELDHYRLVAATPALRRGIAELPRQILDAEPWLAELEERARAQIAQLPVVLFRGSSDLLNRPALRRFRALFADHTMVDLPRADHFIQEDAPLQMVAAIRARFGNRLTSSDAEGARSATLRSA